MEQSSNSKKSNSNKNRRKSKTFSKNNSKKQLSNNNNTNNKINIYYKNLLFFSKKILEAKHSCTPELYQKIILNNLILKKRCHHLAYINELVINTNILREQLKRYYIYEESEERVPKYVSYYQNYLTFFCKPIFNDYLMNKKMVKHMEKVAQIFYNENYADEDELNQSKNPKCNFKIFSKSINYEIDNYANFTKVENDTQNTKFFENFKKNNNLNKNDDISLDDKSKSKLKFRNNDLDLLEKIYKITPILDINKIKDIEQENKNNLSYEGDTKNTEMNSYQKILNEINYKKKEKIKKIFLKKVRFFLIIQVFLIILMAFL